jgi:sporulation-control protein spo0M
LRKQITTLVVLTAATLAGAPAITAAPTLSDQQAPPQRVVIDVTIADGKVAPVNQQMQAAVRQPIIIRVTSDTDDELHVHASPEHTFTVKPGPLQSFQFEVEVPGKVDVELHRLHRVVATITVQ